MSTYTHLQHNFIMFDPFNFANGDVCSAGKIYTIIMAISQRWNPFKVEIFTLYSLIYCNTSNIHACFY